LVVAVFEKNMSQMKVLSFSTWQLWVSNLCYSFSSSLS